MTRWGYLSLVLVAAGFAGAAYAHAHADLIPGDRIPIHWNIRGEADGWVAKDQPFLAFYLLPTLIGAVVALGLFALPWLSPRNYSVAPFRATYDYLFVLVAALFLYLEAVVLVSTFRGRFENQWLLAGMFLFFALIGNVLGKIKPNWWAGIRTPWTLADPVVWARTHRVGAWVFVAVGVIGFVAALAGAPPVACFVFLMVGALAPVLYSLVLYKRLERAGKLDSQRAPAGVAE